MYKFIILMTLISLSSFAQDEDIECQLYPGNDLEVTRTIIDRIYPVDTYGQDRDIILETYYRYNREVRNLMNYVANDLQGADTYSPVELMFYFDDFQAYVIEGDITVIDYGVGGGNGGVVYLDSTGKVLADYFDGDLLYCAPEYLRN